MAKDETEIGITGKPIPKKKRSPKKQHEFEKERRENLGKNVGGRTYKSDVNPNFNPRSVREEVLSYLLGEGFASDERSAEAILGAMSEAWVESIVEEILDESRGGAASPGTPDSYHELSRGVKKNKGRKTSYDTEGNMIRKYATMQLKKRKQPPYND